MRHAPSSTEYSRVDVQVGVRCRHASPSRRAASESVRSGRTGGAARDRIVVARPDGALPLGSAGRLADCAVSQNATCPQAILSYDCHHLPSGRATTPQPCGAAFAASPPRARLAGLQATLSGRRRLDARPHPEPAAGAPAHPAGAPDRGRAAASTWRSCRRSCWAAEPLLDEAVRSGALSEEERASLTWRHPHPHHVHLSAASLR